jgi:thymidine phosphorylase
MQISEIVSYVRDNYSLSRAELKQNIEAKYQHKITDEQLSSIFSALRNNTLEDAIEAVNQEAQEEYEI